MIIRYEHHGYTVSVRDELKGKHRQHCLCFLCSRFVPEDRERNCPIANDTYNNCVKHGITTPVYECPQFQPLNQIVPLSPQELE